MLAFHKWFRQQVESSGRQKQEIAAELNITPPMLSRLMSGDRKPPIKRLKDIAKVFDTDVSEILRRL